MRMCRRGGRESFKSCDLTCTLGLYVYVCVRTCMYTHLQINVSFRERKMLLTNLQACYLDFSTDIEWWMIQRNETCGCGFSVDRKCDFVGMRIWPLLVNMAGVGGGDRAGWLLSVRITEKWGEHRRKYTSFLKSVLQNQMEQNTVVMMKHPSKSILWNTEI